MLQGVEAGLHILHSLLMQQAGELAYHSIMVGSKVVSCLIERLKRYFIETHECWTATLNNKIGLGDPDHPAWFAHPLVLLDEVRGGLTHRLERCWSGTTMNANEGISGLECFHYLMEHFHCLGCPCA
jgi:hypothetical protein